ncbi:E3 ubiquitin/ISG15 ligase TRIM25-like [Cyclopterus lumpus]|uniref:E3 ubiquitin/ISG15 ligase TRIM25-like n=1 Tax=Cyclopterus lumpus TaxID=8103 RepID=UPI001486A3CC|nr:E3 ubiquitin/ISG15 ligase TRIM25-like [Cyclopterus lumpus]
MAHRGDQADVVRFCCSICLDLLKDPVTVPCGHNYCMSCIKSAWDEEDQKKSHSCPLCRQTFDLRPVLLKNTLLADLVEELKKTGLQAAAAAAGGPCYAGPEDVACDFCTERKLKAFKSCLVCLASYCEKHLQPHFKSPAFKKHKLVDPSSVNLQQNVCFRHNEVMKMFCSTDQQCICYLCSVEEHKGHDTVSAAAERTERQQELARRRQRVQQRIQERQRDVKLLRQEVEAINRSAEAVEDGEKIFTELKQQLRTQQRTEVSRVKELQEEFQQEITELKRKDAEMEKLSRTDDHAQFLHRYPSLSKLTEPADSPRPKTNRLRYFEHVTTAVKATRDQIQAFLPETRPSVEPTTRAEFLRYSRQITLDPNTANCQLVLSEENRKITRNINNAPYAKHPERFRNTPQALSKEGLTGRCYWEVEMSRFADVAVAYRSVDRRDCSWSVFGLTEKSWALRCFKGFTFRHDNFSVDRSGPRRSSRVGVYLDHRAGVLSFYSVSETMTLLQRVQTTFTQPLYAGLGLYGFGGDTVELCRLK